MAFVIEQLSAIGGSACGKTTWEYNTTGVTSDVATTPNYFASAHDTLNVGDTLYIQSKQAAKGHSAIITQSDAAAVALGDIEEITV